MDESSAANFPDSFPPSEPDELPRPTPQYRRHAWRIFQRALDPLAPPKPLRLARRPR